jgi:CheY-like chemotaxis protein
MKILVAEDEEGIAMTYELALRARGHEVTLTTNGKLCLEEYELRNTSGSSLFDVVILDYRMPIMDGYETAKRILQINANQRIIFASAFGRETLESMIKNVGIVAEILQKPFDLDVLVDSVEDQYIYSKLQALKINVGDLKSWNPTHQQLTDLYDALLKLRDPKKVFSELLHESGEPKGGKADIASHGKQQQRGNENKECRVVTAIVEDALGYLGPEWLSIFFFHLDHLGVRRENIADSPDKFVEALEKLLGSASSMVRQQIVKAIELNQDVVGQSDTILRFKNKLAEVACLPSTADGSGSGGGRNR